MKSLNNVLKINIIRSLSLKFFTILLGFALVPLTLSFLGNTNYGLWVTIFSLATWINLLDVGIGNGLRNELTKKFESNDLIQKQKLISTGYILIGIISFLILLFLILLNYFTDIGLILSIGGNNDINTFVFMSLIFMTVTLFLKIIHSVFYAIQKSYLINYLNLISSALTLLFLIIPRDSFINMNPLIYISLIYLGFPIIIYFLVNIVYLKKLNLIPSFNFFDKGKVKIIMSLGSSFLIIQFAVIIVNSSDIFIINTILGPESASNFAILNKYSSLIIIATTTFFTPLWNLYTSAISKKEFNWVRNIIHKQRIFTIIVAIACVLLYLIARDVFDLWINNEFEYQNTTLIIILLIAVIQYWNNIHAFFLNGIGAVKLQTKTAIASILINIPLSIFLGLKFGVDGVLISTIISISVFGALGPFNVNKELIKLSDEK